MSPIAPAAVLADLAGLAGLLLDAQSTLGQAARNAVAHDGPLSDPMAHWAVQTTAGRFTPSALAACASKTNPDLAGHQVAVIMAQSVPTAALRAIALPLLRGAQRLIVRPARGQSKFATLLVEALFSRGVAVDLFPTEKSHDFLCPLIERGITHVIAYGRDATLDTLRSLVPPHVGFEGRGHGFGISVVLKNHVADDATTWAVAHDVAHYDQFGCLSPQFVLLEGSVACAVAFGQRLSKALEHVGQKLPRGPLGTELGAQIVQWQGAMAASTEAFYRGADHSVVALANLPFEGSPGARNIAVVAIETLEGIQHVLARLERYLTCVGVAGSLARLADFMKARANEAPRIVSAGSMQDPPLDGYEDPRPVCTTESVGIRHDGAVP